MANFRLTTASMAMIVLAACGGSGRGGTTATAPGISTPTTTTTTSLPTTTTRAEPIRASAVVNGPEEAVYTWRTDQCRPEMLPDLPTLAYRSGDGTINLILSSPTNHRLIGADFDSLHPDCTPIRMSAEDPDPSHYRFREWMGALYTEDGATVHAVIHNEFHGDDASVWSSQRDFSDVQGGKGWSYLSLSGSTESEMSRDGAEWRRGGSLCLVAAWGAHPDGSCDATRRWTAPEAGTFVITLSTADIGVGGGNGVDVGMSHQGSPMWEETIPEGQTEPIVVELEVTVAVGDRLDFWVDARGDASFDATAYTVEVNRGAHPCPARMRDSCLMMALTYSRSTDGGASFSSSSPTEHLIAAMPEQYVPDSGVSGIWQPSNIVRHPDDGYYYMLAQLDVHQGERNVTGMCLLRTAVLDDPASWRAWDGTGFDHVFGNPYADTAVDQALCRTVMDAPVWNVTYNTYLNQFVAISEVPRLQPPGVYFRTSPDLIRWSAPQFIVGSRIGFATGFEVPFEAYPALIDPESGSMSFDTTGDTAYLFYTRVNGYDPLDFDLVRLPIRFER